MASLSSSSRTSFASACYCVVVLLLALVAGRADGFLVAAPHRAAAGGRAVSTAAPLEARAAAAGAAVARKRRLGETAAELMRRASSVQERQQVAAPQSQQAQQQPSPNLQAAEECRVVLEGEEDTLLPPSFFQSLPWSDSITGEGKESLLYMPFVEEQLRHLEALGGPVRELPTPGHIAYQRSERKAAHMASFCVETEDFRKVRFTYMDGGSCVQVFNSVWYPRFDTDAPILGVDLLLFGGHRMLAVVDYQPLSQEGAYKAKYIDHLAPVKAKYPALAEAISNRYYEDTRWFSDQMLFGRLQDAGQVQGTLMPAFREYLAAYTKLVRESRQQQQQGQQEVDAAYVEARHRDYDGYNLVRDPAGKLFEAYFGKGFAHDMLGFLFELAPDSAFAELEAREQAMGLGGGGGGGRPQQHQQQQGGGAAAAPVSVSASATAPMPSSRQ